MDTHFSNRDAKIVVLFKDDEVSENEWLNLAIAGKAFDFPDDCAENIYTMEDGKPYKSEKIK